MASDTWGPHHITDNDRGPLVTIIASLMMVYMVFCFLARILTRTTINGPFGSDDWVITAGTAVAIIHSSAKLVEVRDGFGKRLSDLEDQDILNIQKYPTWVGVETSGIGVELLLALLPAYIAWVAALRIFYLRKQNMLGDPFFYGVDPSVCMEIELHYGLIAATIACLKPFVKSFNTGYLGRLEIIPDAFRDTIPLQNYKPPTMSGGRDNPSIGEGGALSIETTSGNIETITDTRSM
ncbi:conserved hypothetical protein [Histoplasma capsulatum G186AR]|uniref:Integral membrane protein n=1 Tax=Ajellomyces capsulatus (strain G186AR / H82 / ATCC MYA-2454 / RMSCC 2432) TaxID=447093 RepID=C0NH20_AJECG|nr:uncharacterized protein HCBG_02642 [Histoplasma capsulatum G186AR]EEH09105.1 conserved hypothetical protein [Histoplasma capsulatum G186AR]